MNLQAGDLFDGRFRLASKLGEGAFGVVWLATDPAGRQVALKVLKPDSDGRYDVSTRGRFEREVQILAKLRNPHTMTLLSHGESDGLLYMVSEYIPGRDLAELLLERGRLTPPEVEHILRQVLDALHEAHLAGLVHRDIKPANIRIFEAGGDPLRVKLLDFGIARGSYDGGPSMTATGELVGTPRYMSPEQLRGRPLTPASDIYTLGVVAFELLAGASALPGGGLSEQFDRLLDDHEFTAPGLEDAPLMSVIGRMTSANPAVRFQSTVAVTKALDGPMPVWPRTAAAPPSAEPGRRTSKAKLAALLVALLVVVAGVAAFARGNQKTSGKTSVEPVLRRQMPRALIESAKEPEPIDTGVVIDAMDVTKREGAIASGGCDGIEDPDDISALQPYYLPSGYDGRTPMPLVVLLHTDYETAQSLMARFENLADGDDVILIAPSDDGIRSLAGGNAWRGSDDLAKVREKVMSMREAFCVDRARVFVFSNGDGGRVLRFLGCDTRIAAQASRGFSYPEGAERCDRPIASLWLHPMKNGFIPTNGKPNCNGRTRFTPAQMETTWKERNGCRGPASEEFTVGKSVCHKFECETPFEMCRIHGGVPWPGGVASELQKRKDCDPGPAPDFPMVDRIWAFFMEADPLAEVE